MATLKHSQFITFISYSKRYWVWFIIVLLFILGGVVVLSLTRVANTKRSSTQNAILQTYKANEIAQDTLDVDKDFDISRINNQNLQLPQSETTLSSASLSTSQSSQSSESSDQVNSEEIISKIDKVLQTIDTSTYTFSTSQLTIQ